MKLISFSKLKQFMRSFSSFVFKRTTIMDDFSEDEIMCPDGVYLIHMRYDLGSLQFAILDEDIDVVRMEIENGLDTVNQRVGRLGKISTHYAAMVGNLPILELLRTNFANLSKKDDLGWTPLHDAVYMGRINAIRWFLSRGVSVEERGRGNQTALMLAARRGTVRLAMELLCMGARIDSIDDYGRTPLIRAGSSGVLNMIVMLMQFGGNPDVCDRSGRNVLHTAIKSGSLSTLRYLLFRGICDVNQADSDGSTPLIRAVTRSNFDAVPLLLDKGALVNARNNNGYTALHKAVRFGHMKTIALLLERGADPYIADNYGATSIDVANSPEMKQLLQTWSHVHKLIGF